MGLVLKALLLADMIYMSDEEEEEGEEEECPICTDPLHGDIHRWASQVVKVTKIIVMSIHRWASQEVEDHLDENLQVGTAKRWKSQRSSR
jgi:hypothetical protein